MKTRLPLYVALTAAAALVYSMACGSSDEAPRQTPSPQPTAARCFTDGQYLTLDFNIENTPQGKFARLNPAHFGSANSEFPNEYNGPDSYLIQILRGNGSVIGSKKLPANYLPTDGVQTGPKVHFNARLAIPNGAAYFQILDTDGNPLPMGSESAAVSTQKYSLDDLCNGVMR